MIDDRDRDRDRKKRKKEGRKRQKERKRKKKKGTKVQTRIEMIIVLSERLMNMEVQHPLATKTGR